MELILLIKAWLDDYIQEAIFKDVLYNSLEKKLFQHFPLPAWTFNESKSNFSQTLSIWTAYDGLKMFSSSTSILRKRSCFPSL